MSLLATVVTLSVLLAFVATMPNQERHKRQRLMLHGSLIDCVPEEFMNTSEIIRYHGYIAEEHTVTTEDGYILSLQRIPRGRSGVPSNGEVAFLQHGLIASSTNFVANLPSESLAFILADSGYDVWLGNSRGNTYSNRHVKYTTDDAAFWDFSFDEMAKYDLPSSIDYALSVSGQSQLFYVGHSQGTTISFAELSTNQELAKKIKVFFAMAPVATLKEVKGAIRVTSYFTPEISFFFNLFGIKDFLPSTWYIKLLTRALCSSHPGEFVCSNFIFLLAGFDMENLNETRIPVYVSHTPAGTSVKDVVHWAQMARTDNFNMYDYGKYENMKRYNQSTPLSYDVSKVTVPVAIFNADHDWLADPYDVAQLVKKLPNIIYKKDIKKWNHLDFVWGVDARNLVYKDIMQIMEKYH